jgi:hypothetical protein
MDLDTGVDHHQADGYYGDEDVGIDELNLSFFAEDDEDNDNATSTAASHRR